MTLTLVNFLEEGGYSRMVFAGYFNGNGNGNGKNILPYQIERLSSGGNQKVTIMDGHFLIYDTLNNSFEPGKRFKTPLSPHLKDQVFNRGKYLKGKRAIEAEQ